MRITLVLLCLVCLASSARAQFGSFVRTTIPIMTVQGTTMAKTTKSGAQTSYDYETATKTLYVNHTDSTIIQVYPIAYANYSDASGFSVAYADANIKGTCSIPAGGSSGSVIMEATNTLTASVGASLPGPTGSPTFNAEARAQGSNRNNSDFTTTNTQMRTLATIMELTATRTYGDSKVNPNTYVRVISKSSDLTGVFLGNEWLVYGHYHISHSGNPTIPRRDILLYTGTINLNYTAYATEALPASSTFAAEVKSDLSDLWFDALDFQDRDDDTAWILKAKATLAMLQ
jgi:hypothetical protein